MKINTNAQDKKNLFETVYKTYIAVFISRDVEVKVLGSSGLSLCCSVQFIALWVCEKNGNSNKITILSHCFLVELRVRWLHCLLLPPHDQHCPVLTV